MKSCRILPCHGKAFQTRARAPAAAVDIGTFFIFCKCRARIRLVSVNLPESGKLEVTRVMVDKALHVLGRVAEKKPDLVRKFVSLQASDEIDDAALGAFFPVARVSERLSWRSGASLEALTVAG